MKRLCNVGFVLLFMSVVYSVYADAPWEITTVDSGSDGSGAGQHCSLAVINGQPAIAYRYDDARSSLRYARFNGSVWVTTTVEESPVEYTQYVEYISLAQMPDGNPAIAFFDAIASDLRFLRYDGSTWNSTTVDSTGATGRFASLCVINGQPAISYLDSSNDLKYARYDGTTWNLTVVDTAASYTTDGRTSLKAQSNGYPAIAYYASKLKYAAFDGTTWNLSTVDNTSSTGRSASLAFGPDGNPAISYYYATDKKLMFAAFDGTAWNTQTTFPCSTTYQTGMYNSLAFLPNGVPILAWYQKYSSNSGRLNFSWLDNSQWNHTEVDGQYFIDNKGMYASLAILDDYSLGIAYYDINNYQLDFAKTAYPITATDPNIHYTATAWTTRGGESVMIDESATSGATFCTESGNVNSSVDVVSALPNSISATITLRGQSCYEGQCMEYDPDTGECLRWGRCLSWSEETGECLEWQEGQIYQDPNDSSGRLQTQLKIEPTAVMPLGTEVFLHIQLATTIEDPGASATRHCRIYHNSVLVKELASDAEMYIPAVVGDIFDVDMYYSVASDSNYSYMENLLLNITNEEGVIFQPNPDICGDGTMGPDDAVNLFDFNCLAAQWLATPCEAEGWCNNADIDHSGDVGIEDLLEMAAVWLQ